ncbi:unnamed protein product [Brachionus calyciflorus]|uniref:Uncharacterized protein n=1 Tax=Brachionus calyciflorus TaxID=104777 RepID=A0A813M3V0_9BILA|nr:unnamed protein product [Brachionus calyciflorus]
MTTLYSNPNNCTICPENDDQHKMRTSYSYCQCMPDCQTRRKKDGDNNGIVSFVEHVESKYYENLDLINYYQDEQFYFESEINDGVDDCNFHLNYKQKSIRKYEKRMQLSLRLYIQDCMLGCSDIRRK